MTALRRRRPVVISLAVVVALAAASGIAGVEGWRFGVAHVPVDTGCSCGPDPAVIGAVLLSGALGSLAAVLLVAAAFGTVGLTLYLRHRPTPSRSSQPVAQVVPDGHGDPDVQDEQDWWSTRTRQSGQDAILPP